MQNNTVSKGMRLYSDDNARLYLNSFERQAFMNTCYDLPPLQRTFCLMLVYTGCRISEARYLKPGDIQLEEMTVSIRSLKKRGKHHVRELMIPSEFAFDLKVIHFGELSPEEPYLWGEFDRPPPRSKCYRWVKEVMARAGIEGAHACPKGLRHGFGIHAMRCGVQLNMLSKWMGHSSLETTAIYATALGKDEREIAKRMWV